MKTLFRAYLEQNADDDDIYDAPLIARRKVASGSVHEE